MESMYFVFLIILASVIIIIGAPLAYFICRALYQKTDYYTQTHHSFSSIQFDKGIQGEFLIWECLQSVPGYKRCLFNCYLPKDNGETTEVDAILLHGSGIYILESKNYSGWIFGTETQPYWVQSLPGPYGQARKTKFFNPVIQNSVHLKWLSRYLNKSPDYFRSYIVFGDGCTLKDIKLTSGRHCVITKFNLLSSLMDAIQSSRFNLSPEEIDSLYGRLYPLTQVSELQKSTHIQEVRQKKEFTNTQSRNYTDAHKQHFEFCPLCGGRLVLRTASKGSYAGQKFWGCSNYPKCRYIRNILFENGMQLPPQ